MTTRAAAERPARRDGFAVRLCLESESVRIVLAGDLDAHAARLFTAVCESASNAARHKVIVDMSQVVRLDAAVASVLNEWRERLRVRGTVLVVSAAPQVRVHSVVDQGAPRE
jgi:anti-anti-sigma regulatory factor